VGTLRDPRIGVADAMATRAAEAIDISILSRFRIKSCGWDVRGCGMRRPERGIRCVG
jgi:hypothetical protein